MTPQRPLTTWPDTPAEIQAITTIAETFLGDHPELLRTLKTGDADIVFCQEAFGCSADELLTLACVIKYIGLQGKSVIIGGYKFDAESNV